MSSTNNESHDVDDVEVQLVIDQGSNDATPIRHQFLKEKEVRPTETSPRHCSTTLTLTPTPPGRDEGAPCLLMVGSDSFWL